MVPRKIPEREHLAKTVTVYVSRVSRFMDYWIDYWLSALSQIFTTVVLVISGQGGMPAGKNLARLELPLQ